MISMIRLLVPAGIAATLLAGCAADGSGGIFQTGSVDAQVVPVQQATAAPKPSAACVTLATQIDGLRKEGTIDRLEKAAAGSGATVPVKRASLVKQVEYNKATAEFQAKCAPAIPLQAAAPAPAMPPPPAAKTAAVAITAAAAAPAVKAAAKAVSAQAASGVTSVPPTPPAAQPQ